MEEKDDKARTEATFRYTVQNFSKLKKSAFSPAFYVRNLAWRIMVKRQNSQNGAKPLLLGIFLQCNNESECSSWSCNANVQLRLLSVHPKGKTVSRNFQQLWSSKGNKNNWVFVDSMAWNDVLDRKKGFIENDAITLEVHVVADALHVVSLEIFHLIEAIQRNSLDDIESLSINRNMINKIDDKGNTPLHYAIMSESFEIVEYLINAKANVCKPAKNGKKPLLTAVETGNIDIIQLLLRHGAGDSIQSAFLQAVTLQNLEIIELLIEHGALLNINYKDGHTPLTKSVEIENLDIVKVLIEHGADASMPKSDGTSPLSLALKIGNLEISNYLIDNDGKLSSDSDQAFEYLPKYIEEDNFDMIEILVKLGAKLDAFYECGDTPLTKATKLEDFEIVEYLIESGANVNQSNRNGKVPLAVAASNHDILIAKLLIQSQACLDLAKEEIEEFASFDEDFDIYLKMLRKSKINSFMDFGQEAAP